MNFCMADNSKAKNLSFQNQCTHHFEFWKIQKNLGGNVQSENGRFWSIRIPLFGVCVASHRKWCILSHFLPFQRATPSK